MADVSMGLVKNENVRTCLTSHVTLHTNCILTLFEFSLKNESKVGCYVKSKCQISDNTVRKIGELIIMRMKIITNFD